MQQTNSRIFTYQTRCETSVEEDQVLSQTAAHLSKVERALFKDFCSGKKLTSCKSEYIEKYKITARQFNAIWKSLDGKISSCKKKRNEQILLLKTKIKNLQKQIAHLKIPFKIHHKKRKLFALTTKLQRLEKDKEENRIRICFGGKDLFHKQFSLQENGYPDHSAWKSDWQKKRNSSFFCLGSKDESYGNQTCQLQENTLAIRLPNIFSQKILQIHNLQLPYGQKEIEECLQENLLRKTSPHLGKAIHYRFVKDEKSWRVFISIEQTRPKIISKKGFGEIGIDINAAHLALVETDRFGNVIKKKTIPCSTYGKSKNARKDLIHRATKQVVEYAVQVQKPIVLEELNFQKKKQSLKGSRYSRMLSSFAYHQIFESFESQCFKNGIELSTVNPAFSTIIGEVKFKSRYGLSSHHSAAMVIARRKNHFSEEPPTNLWKNFESAFSLPVRNREKHVVRHEAHIN